MSLVPVFIDELTSEWFEQNRLQNDTSAMCLQTLDQDGLNSPTTSDESYASITHRMPTPFSYGLGHVLSETTQTDTITLDALDSKWCFQMERLSIDDTTPKMMPTDEVYNPEFGYSDMQGIYNSVDCGYLMENLSLGPVSVPSHKRWMPRVGGRPSKGRSIVDSTHQQTTLNKKIDPKIKEYALSRSAIVQLTPFNSDLLPGESFPSTLGCTSRDDSNNAVVISTRMDRDMAREEMCDLLMEEHMAWAAEPPTTLRERFRGLKRNTSVIQSATGALVKKKKVRSCLSTTEMIGSISTNPLFENVTPIVVPVIGNQESQTHILNRREGLPSLNLSLGECLLSPNGDLQAIQNTNNYVDMKVL